MLILDSDRRTNIAVSCHLSAEPYEIRVAYNPARYIYPKIVGWITGASLGDECQVPSSIVP